MSNPTFLLKNGKSSRPCFSRSNSGLSLFAHLLYSWSSMSFPSQVFPFISCGPSSSMRYPRLSLFVSHSSKSCGWLHSTLAAGLRSFSISQRNISLITDAGAAGLPLATYIFFSKSLALVKFSGVSPPSFGSPSFSHKVARFAAIALVTSSVLLPSGTSASFNASILLLFLVSQSFRSRKVFCVLISFNNCVTSSMVAFL